MSKITQSDLDKLAVKELEEVIKMAQSTILVKKDQEIEQLQTKFKEMAAQHGYSVNEVIGSAPAKKKGAAGGALPPKYRDPDNPDNTWSGRGRKPGWLNQRLDAGATLEDFAI